MKMRRILVKLIVIVALEIYRKHFAHEKGKIFIYIKLLKTLNGIFKYFLLFYNKLSKNLEDIRF